MLDAFRPYMSDEKITSFQRDLTDIDVAVSESRDRLDPLLGTERAYPSYTDFVQQWPAIDAEMSDMLRTMHRALDNFAAVDALPPFPLFPWFFVLPGGSVVAVAMWGLAGGGDRGTRNAAAALAVLGVLLIAAPAVFQMFTRAPRGSEMIDDFRPLMTTAKVQRIQGYFVVIGAGEGTIRNQVLPALEQDGIDTELPAVRQLSARWPAISSEMAPMIGAMSDNVDNYAAVDALPSFSLFPWFFVAPGFLIAGLGVIARRWSVELPRPAT